MPTGSIVEDVHRHAQRRQRSGERDNVRKTLKATNIKCIRCSRPFRVSGNGEGGYRDADVGVIRLLLVGGDLLLVFALLFDAVGESLVRSMR